MKILYTAEVTATGGREGQARSTDGAFSVDLRTPQELNGSGGSGTNPEQLFATGYAACFQSALITVARRQHQDTSKSTVTARVGIGPAGGGRFGLEVELHVHLPETERSVGEKLVTLAHEVCPYSNATRGNIPVRPGRSGTGSCCRFLVMALIGDKQAAASAARFLCSVRSIVITLFAPVHPHTMSAQTSIRRTAIDWARRWLKYCRDDGE